MERQRAEAEREKKKMELGMHNDESGLTFLDIGDWSPGLTKVMVIGENGIGDW